MCHFYFEFRRSTLTAVVFSLLFPSAVLGSESAVRTFPDGTPSDRRHPQAPPIKLAADDWIYLKLPRPGAAYEALASSPNGVVLFRNLKDGSYHRWRTGEMTELKPDQSPWRLPALLDKGPVPDGPDLVSLKLNNYVVNASGGIGLAYVMKRQGSNVDWEDEYIHFWPPASTAPRTIQGEFYLKDVEWDGGIYRTVKRHSRLLTAANDGFIFGEFSRIEPRPTDVPFDSFYRYPSTGAGLADASWFGSDFVLTVANDRGDHIGKRVGGNGATISGVVGYANVTFAPVYISENGVVLGRNGLANFSPLGSAGAQVLYSLADGVMPLPTGGRVMTVDEQNRPNGFDLDGKPVVWDTKRDSSGVPLVPKQYELKPYVPMPMPAGWSSTHLIAPGTTKHQLGIMTNAGTNQTLPFFAIRGGLRVDANLDGAIAIDGSDSTSSTNPFRFWLNDDNDGTVNSSMPGLYTEFEQDDQPVSGYSSRNCNDLAINGTRDLEDFARLWINVSGLRNMVTGANPVLQIGLKWTDVSQGSPAIRLFRAAEATGGMGYLFNSTTAAQQLDQTGQSYGTALGSGMVETASTYIVPQVALANLSESQPNIRLLFEGCRAGKGRLRLVVLKQDGTEVGEGPGVWMDLKSSKDFIERWSCGDGDLAEVQPVVRQTANSASPAWGNPTKDEEKDYVLYVHGYNMKEFEKQRWIETTFKRLYWLGYKGRVGGFTWPCSDSALPYDQSEERAWQSAAQLRALLGSLKIAGLQVHVLGHSQGNVVVGEALRQWAAENHKKADGSPDPLVRTYVASQAAIQAHCYDPNAALIPGFTGSLSDDGTPNVYANYPLTGAPYMSVAAMSGAATRFRNFQNPDDYALTGNSAGFPVHPGWQLNQRLKPDIGYTFENATGIFRSGAILAFPGDRFLIFSYAAEGRSLALGSTVTDGVFSGGDYSLRNQLGYGLDHIWHSGQFRSSMAERYQYWRAFMQAADLTPNGL